MKLVPAGSITVWLTVIVRSLESVLRDDVVSIFYMLELSLVSPEDEYVAVPFSTSKVSL